jgi:hypothetical protein
MIWFIGDWQSQMKEGVATTPWGRGERHPHGPRVATSHPSVFYIFFKKKKINLACTIQTILKGDMSHATVQTSSSRIVLFVQ